MTLKEKVKQIKPEMVSELAFAGVVGCPYEYDFLNQLPECPYRGSGGCCKENCEMCWGREYVEPIKKKKTVPLDKPFEQMLISAERYAFGRRTYIVSDTVGYIKPLLSELSEHCLTVLHADLQEEVKLAEYVGNYSNFGHECDRQDWLALYKALCEEIERRTRK